MASAEAVELLRSGLPDGEERESVSLAARLGEWPLLLKIVNRQLRELVQDEGQSVQRISVKSMRLWILKDSIAEDVQIPISVLERFWGLGGFQVRKFCRRLHDLSLALEFDAELGTVRIHDVVRQVLIDWRLELLDSRVNLSDRAPDKDAWNRIFLIRIHE